MITQLPVVVPPAPGRPQVGDADHPMRLVTREVAFEPGSWTPDLAERVAAAFDTLAEGWDNRDIGPFDAVTDALERGGIEPGGRALEVGAGTGAATVHLAGRFELLAVLDIAPAMLARLDPALGARVLGDAARLPVADGSVDLVVLANALLFPHEVDRVLAPAGAVLWANALGDATPIHLPAEDVAAALPGAWAGVASEAGWGTWTVLRRA